MIGLIVNLHEDGDDGEAADDGAVVALAREDVQRAHRALHDLFHAHAVGVGARRSRAGSLLDRDAIHKNSSRFWPLLEGFLRCIFQ